MKKVFLLVIALSFVAVIFVFAPQHQVQASEKVVNETIEQESKYVVVERTFFSFPPDMYFYDDGTFRGYIYLEDSWQESIDPEEWVGVYAGYVYTGAVPIPPKTASN